MPQYNQPYAERLSHPIPNEVQRRRRRFRHTRRSCRDGRPYNTMAWTVPNDLVVGRIKPMWHVDRDYWVAGCKALVGSHHEDDHPADDGTPSGSSIKIQMYRINNRTGNGAKIMASDNKLVIEENKHHDAVGDTDDYFKDNDFDILKIRRGDWVYPEILQVGSGRPGNTLEISLILVPYPWPDRLDDDD